MEIEQIKLCAYHFGMHISFNFNFAPISTNKAFRSISRGKFSSTIKSKEYRQFETLIEESIDKTRLNMLDTFYDKSKHVLQCRIIWFTPRFFTKKNELSLTCGDTDNIIKPTWDSILKLSGNLNDAYIKNVNVFQFPCEKERFEVHFHVEEIENYLKIVL